MSLLPVFVEWRDPKDDKRVWRVPVVQFSNDLKTALILHEREFIIVKIAEIKFNKWDL